MIEAVKKLVYKVPHVGPLLRTWPGRFIALVVASQLLLPLHYYAVRRDEHDERFAWRMFSPMRQARCVPQLTVDGNPVEIAFEFHKAWQELAERGRLHVVEAMGQRMCKANPGSSVTITLECTYLDRPKSSIGGFNLCEIPEL